MKKEYLSNLHTLMFDGEGGEGGAGASEGATDVTSTGTVEYGLPEDGAEDSQDGTDTDGQEEPPDLQAEFDELIRGQYADQFQNAVQGIMEQRFRNTENYQETNAKWERATAPLFALYGLKPGDIDGLESAVERDESLYSQRADQEGITAQQFRENLRLKMEAEQGRAFKEQMEAEAQKRETFARWDREAAELKLIVPNFDLDMELNNQEFLDALDRGNSVKDAFFIAHMSEILSGTQAETKAETQNRFVENFRARQARPAENAGSSTPAVTRKADPSKWTDEDMAEVERRVAAGERIRL